MNPVITAVSVLGGIGVASAAILYAVAKRFKVEEDPRIDEVESLLPGANCGACGFKGCRDFAVNCVTENSLEHKFCPVGGDKAMSAIGNVLGLKAETGTPRVAVLRCNGSCMARKAVTHFDGPRSCAIERMVYAGETDCQYGCLGCGDCESVCRFGAIHVDPATHLPVVDEELCTSCGACVEACPGKLIELRYKGPKGRRVYVACSNHDRGAIAMKECQNSCIGCGKCVKTCPFDAITLTGSLAYIDYTKCKLCRKCVAVCPKHCIHAVNFPAPAAPKPERKEEETVC